MGDRRLLFSISPSLLTMADTGSEPRKPDEPEAAPQRKRLHTPTMSCTERAVKECAAPYRDEIDSQKLNVKGDINLEALKDHLFHEGRLHKADLIALLERTTALFRAEETLLRVTAPITVCGDIHGQFYDLLKLFEVGGKPSETNYLFLGDYVDRGCFSIECVIYLWAHKCVYPKSFTLLRGNHECRHLTDYFTFKEECLKKYDEEVYDAVMNSFDCLPLCALLNDQFLLVHGGLSPEIRTLDDIRAIDRFREPPSSGAMCDLLWSDPMEDFSPDIEDEFVFNDTRGCSYMYSYKAACNFLDRNNLLSIIRAHEAQDTGYKMYRKGAKGFPSVITMFSAPNYLDSYGNKGAVLRYDQNVMNIRQFNCMPHPYWLPNFMDVFTWSVPFVAEKVAEIIYVLYKVVEEEEEKIADQVPEREKLDPEQVRAKVRSVARMLAMYRTLTNEREKLMQLRGLNNGVLPRGMLTASSEEIDKALGDFARMKQVDKRFERRPSEADIAEKHAAARSPLQRTNSRPNTAEPSAADAAAPLSPRALSAPAATEAAPQ